MLNCLPLRVCGGGVQSSSREASRDEEGDRYGGGGREKGANSEKQY